MSEVTSNFVREHPNQVIQDDMRFHTPTKIKKLDESNYSPNQTFDVSICHHNSISGEGALDTQDKANTS
jgi:hypothetical protein